MTGECCTRAERTASRTPRRSPHQNVDAPGQSAGPASDVWLALSLPWRTHPLIPEVTVVAAGMSAVAQTNVQCVADGITEEIERHHRQCQGNAWDDRLPPGRGERVLRVGQHRSPRELRRLNPEADEAQARLGEDQHAGRRGPEHDDRAADVREDVLEKNP